MNSTQRPEEGSSRGGDRRQNDRRRTDRRTPLPPWRRPWAYAAYGVTGAMLLVLILSLENDAGEAGTAPVEVSTRVAGPAVDSTPALGAASPVEDAYGPAGFERLLAEGEGAVGKRVRTTIYCEPIRSVALRSGEGVTAHEAVVAAADAASRVPAAECRWGETSTAPQMLLVVPPESAERFARSPEVEQGFVTRREVRAEVQWIGQSQALALRNVAVLRSID